jgi:hypothetical protein
MNRRRLIASLAGSAAALAVAPALPAAVPPTDRRDRTIPLRSWEVHKPVPELRLEAGDAVTEWVNTHELSRHRGNTMADLPAGSWPAFLAAIGAGAVTISRFYPEADPSDLIAEHGLSRALELAWERHEAHIIEHSKARVLAETVEW